MKNKAKQFEEADEQFEGPRQTIKNMFNVKHERYVAYAGELLERRI